MVAAASHAPSASLLRTELLFRALADPTRLRILHLLTSGELCVCDLAAVLRVPQPKVSRHLAYLRRAGLVSARRAGFWSHYQLAAAASPLHAKLLDCLACLHALPDLAADARTLRARRPDRSITPCC
jgi:ArsR family transcriptional regulator, arsenate/arsenite/antimonite-responsive transcriptional repressor